MEEKINGRNVYLDIFRFLLAFMIICIHLTGEQYSFFPVYRLAVPMFFMISGYFIYDKDSDAQIKKSNLFISRSAKYMLIGIIFYIIYEFIFCLIDKISLGWFFTTIFYEGSSPLFHFLILNAPIPYYTVGAQIWFLIAMFVLSIIHFFIIKYQKTNWYKIIVPICFAIYFFFSGYMYIIQSHTDIPIRYMRNAWFLGLPNFGLGYLIASYRTDNKSKYKYIYLILAILFFIIQIPEHLLISTENSKLEMYISGVISAVFWLKFFMEIKKSDCHFFYKWIGKSAPFYIYILHMGVACLLSRFISFSNLMFKSFVVFMVSLLIYEAFFLLCKFLKHNKRKCREYANTVIHNN